MTRVVIPVFLKICQCVPTDDLMCEHVCPSVLVLGNYCIWHPESPHLGFQSVKLSSPKALV